MSPRQDIPLGKLSVWDGNVRKTGVTAGLDELAASIAAHGLMNPLTVRMAVKGRFEVVAGQRRLLALRKLAKAGAWPKNTPVPCTVIEAEQDAGELSLAENVVRVAMHPADQFEAWRGLIERGATPAEVGDRFGVTEATVRKRMALGRVSPRLLSLYRDGALTLEALQAFTVSDDHGRQDAVWDGLNGWQKTDPRSIRDALTASEIPTRDKRVRFVGLDAYEAAGGIVRRDLFAEDGGGTCQDEALIERLVREKLDDIAAEVKAEGWAWTEALPSFGWQELQAFGQAEPDHDEESDDEPEGDGGEAVPVWPDAAKAMAGAVIYLGYDGTAQIERGLIRSDDLPDEADGGESGDEDALPDGDAGEADEPKASALPVSLVEELTAQRTAALRAELAQSPATALALVVFTLAAPLFCRGHGGVLDLRMASRRLPLAGQGEVRAVADLDTAREGMADRLPGDEAALWDWCLTASQSDLLDVLAVVAAHGLDAVVTKVNANPRGVKQGEALGKALTLDMAQWYRPTASGYFGRVTKAVILSDLEEARQAPCAPAWAKLPKADLAALAEREVAATGWLPGPVR